MIIDNNTRIGIIIALMVVGVAMNVREGEDSLLIQFVLSLIAYALLFEGVLLMSI